MNMTPPVTQACGPFVTRAKMCALQARDGAQNLPRHAKNGFARRLAGWPPPKPRKSPQSRGGGRCRPRRPSRTRSGAATCTAHGRPRWPYCRNQPKCFAFRPERPFVPAFKKSTRNTRNILVSTCFYFTFIVTPRRCCASGCNIVSVCFC
jgi:hypothetical protein